MHYFNLQELPNSKHGNENNFKVKAPIPGRTSLLDSLLICSLVTLLNFNSL